MKAITLWPEWLWVIRNLGKRVENRTWRLSNSHTFKPILLHAGKRVGGGKVEDGLYWVYQTALYNGYECVAFSDALKFEDKVLRISDLDYGKIVGVTAFSCCDRCSGKWSIDGQWHWRMMYAKFFDNPVPCRGAQGFWEVPKNVIGSVNDQMLELGFKL